MKERWEHDQPECDVELQLDGIQTKTGFEVTLDRTEALPSAQKELVDAVLAEAGATLKEEVNRCNRAIGAVMQYCEVEEGGMRPTVSKKFSNVIDKRVANAKTPKIRYFMSDRLSNH